EAAQEAARGPCGPQPFPKQGGRATTPPTPTKGGAVSPSAASATPTAVTPTGGKACTPGGSTRSHSPVHVEVSRDLSEATPQDRHSLRPPVRPARCALERHRGAPALKAS
ncbi:unnamed protein product, partial [Prorocentrum cordatum]